MSLRQKAGFLHADLVEWIGVYSKVAVPSFDKPERI